MLKVIKAGFYTSIQDAGRFGQRAYGVPVSGVMDSYSSQFANTILGNEKSAAVLEITMTGPTLLFLEPTIIAISGANMQPKLNNNLIKINAAINIKANDILSFGKLTSGFRAYLAIKKGFFSETVLGSMSMYMPITKVNRITTNDILKYKSFNKKRSTLNANVKYNIKILNSYMLDAFRGPEFYKLPREVQRQFSEIDFIVSKHNNRMAYQLEPLLENNLDQILTAPVLPGTVQLTPSGQLIVLMRDCQTTGGYPRVLQLTESAINILNQKFTGSSVKIRLKE